MKPYGREKKIKGCGKWKIDMHPKKGFMNWWESMSTILPRTTMKIIWKKDNEI